MAVGVPAAATNFLFQAAAIAATMLVARYGAAALAGYGVAQRLELVQTPMSYALGSAAVAMGGLADPGAPASRHARVP